MFVCKVLFFFSLFMIFYVYAGYPFCVWILARMIHNSVDKAKYEPTVTILISAYNEEKYIGQTIANKLQLDYQKSKLEIIVISDESTDKTNEIINQFNNQNVSLLLQKPRSGKTSALNLAIPHAHGEILVFSDANSIYAPDALKQIVANFHDPEVGYVTGKMIYTDSDGTPIGDGCSAYMKYENFLRSMETQIGSVVGVDGGIDAMRKDIHSKLNSDQLSDFVQPLKVVKKGFRVVYESSALLKEDSLQESRDEYRMRVRVTLRALWALKDMDCLLFGRGGFLFSWQLWSHKVLRYFCFVFLGIAFAANLLLVSNDPIFSAFLACQLVCYTGAVLSPVFVHYGRDFTLLRLLYYFMLLNVASLHATIKFLQGKKQVIWSPRKG
ncbi:MAG: glycosyltransferase family 2 protein [Candidatus Electrothrix sp. GW3-4]|uniref:glycosyltransferase family 2 protein n=1 Tax=Candidatus Electrothrix sp. GW3-4 TaxID=3126740 RepID=UPI0030D0AE03